MSRLCLLTNANARQRRSSHSSCTDTLVSFAAVHVHNEAWRHAAWPSGSTIISRSPAVVSPTPKATGSFAGYLLPSGRQPRRSGPRQAASCHYHIAACTSKRHASAANSTRQRRRVDESRPKALVGEGPAPAAATTAGSSSCPASASPPASAGWGHAACRSSCCGGHRAVCCRWGWGEGGGGRGTTGGGAGDGARGLDARRDLPGGRVRVRRPQEVRRDGLRV